MTDYLFDTNHASALWKKDTRLRNQILQKTIASLGLPRPVIAELWYMVYNSQRIQINVRDMEQLISMFRKWELDADSAREFGKIKAELRKKGKMIPAIDIQIAAIARSKNLIVLTSDKHFSYIEKLTIENWLS